MTGMGVDGAAGLLELRTAGARTIAQQGQAVVVEDMGGIKSGLAEVGPKRTIRVKLRQISRHAAGHCIDLNELNCRSLRQECFYLPD